MEIDHFNFFHVAETWDNAPGAQEKGVISDLVTAGGANLHYDIPFVDAPNSGMKDEMSIYRVWADDKPWYIVVPGISS